jgi:ATP-dependent Lon protease
MKDVVVPKLNRRDHPELPATVKRDIRFHFVSDMDQVLGICLTGFAARSRRKSAEPS